MGTGSCFPGVKAAGKLTTHLHLVPRSRMREVIPPSPQKTFMKWCLVKHMDNFQKLPILKMLHSTQRG